MAVIRDSVLDQYGNALPGALVILYDYFTNAELWRMNTNSLGWFEFSVSTGVYKIQVSGSGLTTRIITPITAIDPYSAATHTADGLMSFNDKIKLDGLPAAVTLRGLGDVKLTQTTPEDLDALMYSVAAQAWVNIKRADAPFALKSNFVTAGGTLNQAGKYVQLNSLGFVDYSFLNVTPIGGTSSFVGRIPVLDSAGFLDTSMYRSSAVGGAQFANFLAKIGPGGTIDVSLVPTATVGGASAANKIPKLNNSGRLDPTLLPTSGGTFKGTIDLTIGYIDPAWADGDYGSSKTAGTVDASWNAHLNDPIPTTTKVGDQIFFTGGKYSVVPSATDLSAYLPRDGSSPMTGQLPLIDQTAALPTGVQAISRAAADMLYLAKTPGTIPSVTQLTNKNTGVSLDGVQGKIVMANSALLPAAMAGPRPARFSLANLSITPASTVLVIHLTTGTLGAYRAWTDTPVAGNVMVNVENISGVSKSEPITLQFFVLG